jgi:hypothetical protein
MVGETLGPFLIPVVVFVVGVLAYILLWLLTREGYLSSEDQNR